VDKLEETVIGVDSRGTSYILEEGGRFGTSNERVEITQVRVGWWEWCVTNFSSYLC